MSRQNSPARMRRWASASSVTGGLSCWTSHSSQPVSLSSTLALGTCAGRARVWVVSSGCEIIIVALQRKPVARHGDVIRSWIPAGPPASALISNSSYSTHVAWLSQAFVSAVDVLTLGRRDRQVGTCQRVGAYCVEA